MVNYLTFSDGAKFALIARNLFTHGTFTTDFSFWGSQFFTTGGIPYLIPYIINFFFRVFGVSDIAVIYFSLCFYLLSVICVFLLGKKIYGVWVGVLSAVALAANTNFIDYATSGASEPLFTFEILLAIYLFSHKKIWVDIFGFLVLGLMYFSRPQAFIFISGIIFFWMILRLGIKKGLLMFLGLGFLGILLDKYIIYPLSFKYPLTPIITRGLQSIFAYSSFSAVSDGLRGGLGSGLTMLGVLKKVFYNLYNFYKLIPEILNPYLFGFFIVGLFVNFKDNLQKIFKYSSIFMVVCTFLVTALTIPFYRYLHPVVPLIYILAIATLSKFMTNKRALIMVLLILTVGQTLGVLLLDSRFKAKTVNADKPPVYALLSYKLKETTNKDDIVLTNLDTWGSWYGERKTVWYPLTVSQFVPKIREFDAIYLTSYKKDDENYYMGDGWREIFENPKNPTKWMCDGCEVIAKEFKLKDEYTFPQNENYQKEDAYSVLLIRK